MAYVITDSCLKGSPCVEVCPTDCIHPKQDEPGFEAATQMYVDPEGCIDCGACIPVCTSDLIHALDDVPEDKKEFIEKNSAYYVTNRRIISSGSLPGLLRNYRASDER